MLADVGYDRLTMDAVAQRAKASKATLYRRWNGKVSLVIDALHHHHQQQAPTVPVDTGSLRGDLIESYCGTGGLTDKPEVAAFGAILTAVMRDPEFAAAFRRDVVGAQARPPPRRSSSGPRAAARSAPASTSSCWPRPWPGSCMHRFFLVGEAPTEELVTSVIDQIIMPAATAAGSDVPSHKERDNQ